MYSNEVDIRIANAMKSGNDIELRVWRAIKTAFLNYLKAKSGNSLTNEVELQIISKMATQRKDSINQYNAAGRNDLAIHEEEELNILQTLLPKEATEDDIKNEIENIVKSLDHSPTMADMKTVMSSIKSKYPTVNGGVVSKIFKNYICG